VKIRSLLSVLALALIVACEVPPEPAPAAPARALTPEEANNLLDLGRGASVISRTGELSLEQSALHPIDGIRQSFWASPPRSSSDTLVFALAAPSRIDRIGITPTANGAPPLRVRFERSSDGKSWTEVAVLDVPSGPSPFYANMPPFEAESLRVTTLDVNTEFALIHTVYASGAELRPPNTRDFSGCWTINGIPARFEQTGSHITGTIATTPPTWIEGASNGRVTKLTWTQGPTWGSAMVAMPPDERTLTGTMFFDIVYPEHQGPSWFGTRCSDATGVAVPKDFPARALESAGFWSMHGLIFDERDQLVEDASRATLDALAAATAKGRFRILSHDFLTQDRAENRRHAKARLASLRAVLQKRGVDLTRIELGVAPDPEEWVVAQVQRLLWTRIDLERAP